MRNKNNKFEHTAMLWERKINGCQLRHNLAFQPRPVCIAVSPVPKHLQYWNDHLHLVFWPYNLDEPWQFQNGVLGDVSIPYFTYTSIWANLDGIHYWTKPAFWTEVGWNHWKLRFVDCFPHHESLGTWHLYMKKVGMCCSKTVTV